MTPSAYSLLKLYRRGWYSAGSVWVWNNYAYNWWIKFISKWTVHTERYTQIKRSYAKTQFYKHTANTYEIIRILRFKPCIELVDHYRLSRPANVSVLMAICDIDIDPVTLHQIQYKLTWKKEGLGKNILGRVWIGTIVFHIFASNITSNTAQTNMEELFCIILYFLSIHSYCCK